MKPRISSFSHGNPISTHFNHDETLVSQILLQLPDLISAECASSKKISHTAIPWGAKRRRSAPLPPPPPIKACNASAASLTDSDLTNLNGSARILVLTTPPDPNALFSNNVETQKAGTRETSIGGEFKNDAARVDRSFAAPPLRDSLFPDEPTAGFSKTPIEGTPLDDEAREMHGGHGGTASFEGGDHEGRTMIDLNAMPSGAECLEPCDPRNCVILMDNADRAKFKEARKRRAEIQRMKSSQHLSHRVNNPIASVTFKFAAPLPH